jgi:predicted DNA-binding transcriptional regulator AlpA
MDKENNKITLYDTRCWTNVLEGLKSTFKGWVREAVEDVISEKMCNVNLEDKRLTVVELCKRWNISKNTLYNWEKNGVIQPLPLKGKKKLYSMADIHSAEINGFVKTAC